MVELPSHGRRSRPVEPAGVGHQLQQVGQPSLDLLEVGLGSVDHRLGLPHAGGDPLLLAPQDVDRHRSGVIRRHQFGAFGVEPGQPLLLFLPGPDLGAAPAADEVEHRPANGGDLRGRQLDAVPEFLYRRFDAVHGQVLLAAFGPLLLPTEAVEIVVLLTRGLADLGDAEPGAALPAEDRGLQVVRVLVGLLLGVPAGQLEGLDRLEELARDQRRVRARVLHALEGDDTDVVRVAGDTIQQLRPDLRMVFVTHDIHFALSREPARYLLAQPAAGLKQIELDETLPSDLRRDILGAASFSYFVIRVVFCEGSDSDRSYDQVVLREWCTGRDTVVVPVGSRANVRRYVETFNRVELVSNPRAVGVIDRDFDSDSVLEALSSNLVVLPVHEIEGLICVPAVAARLARHLGVTALDSISLVKASIKHGMASRVAFERAKIRIVNPLEDVVRTPDAGWDRQDFRARAVDIDQSVAAAAKSAAVFDGELLEAEAVAAGNDVAAILRLFPSKPIAAAVARGMGSSVPALLSLIANALRDSAQGSGDLQALGDDLVAAFDSLGLPERGVEERFIATAR